MGSDNFDQLARITQHLGTQGLEDYLTKYGIKLDSEFEGILPKHDKVPWETLVTPKNKHLANSPAIALLDKMLCYDHYMRPTAAEAMGDPYFDIIRREEEKGLPPQPSSSSPPTTTPASTSPSTTTSTTATTSSPITGTISTKEPVTSTAQRS